MLLLLLLHHVRLRHRLHWLHIGVRIPIRWHHVRLLRRLLYHRLTSIMSAKSESLFIHIVSNSRVFNISHNRKITPHIIPDHPIGYALCTLLLLLEHIARSSPSLVSIKTINDKEKWLTLPAVYILSPIYTLELQYIRCCNIFLGGDPGRHLDTFEQFCLKHGPGLVHRIPIPNTDGLV